MRQLVHGGGGDRVSRRETDGRVNKWPGGTACRTVESLGDHNLGGIDDGVTGPTSA